jgi:hypothetical protein
MVIGWFKKIQKNGGLLGPQGFPGPPGVPRPLILLVPPRVFAPSRVFVPPGVCCILFVIGGPRKQNCHRARKFSPRPCSQSHVACPQAAVMRCRSAPEADGSQVKSKVGKSNYGLVTLVCQYNIALWRRILAF